MILEQFESMSLFRFSHFQTFTNRLGQEFHQQLLIWGLLRWNTTVALHLVTKEGRGWGAKDFWTRQVCFSLQRTAGSESTARKSPHTTYFETTQTLRRSTHRMEFQQGRMRGLRYLPWTTEVPSGPQGQSWAVLVGLGEVWRLQIPPCSHPSIKTPLHNPGLERQGKTILSSFLSLSFSLSRIPDI